MFTSLLALLAFSLPAQTPAKAAAPASAESFIPANAMLIVRLGSVDTVARELGLFPNGKDPIDMLKTGVHVDARWKLLDRTQPLIVAVSPPDKHPPVEFTIIATCTDPAAFAADPALNKAGWTCSTSGKLIVLSSSKPGPVLASDSPLRAGLDRYDFVARVAMEPVMDQYGELIHSSLDQAKLALDHAAAASDKPGSAAAGTSMMIAMAAAIDEIESVDIHFSQAADESHLGFALVAQADTDLAKNTPVDASRLPEVARGIDTGAAFAGLGAVDFQKYMAWLKSFSGLRSADKSDAQQELSKLSDAFMRIYADTGPVGSMSFTVDAGGIRGSAFLQPKEGAPYLTRVADALKTLSWMEVVGPEKREVEGVDVTTYYAKPDMRELVELAGPAAAPNDAQMATFNGIMAVLFGPKGIELSSAQKDDWLVFEFGSSSELPRALSRLSATGSSDAGASMLQALGGMNPGLVYRIDFGRLFGGIADLGAKFAAADKDADFTELGMLRELPAVLIAAGAEGRTWKLEITTNLPSFVQAVQRIEATPTPAKNKKRVTADITAIVGALKEYAMNNAGKYPQSLDVLVKPDENGYRYLNTKTVPLDPWGHPYLYTAPVPGNPEPRVYTLGKDGKQGGSGEDADIDNVSIEEGR